MTNETPTTKNETKNPSLRTVLIVAAIFILVPIAWLLWGQCGKLSVAGDARAMRDIVSEYQDALALAGDTPRLLLAQPLHDMQAITRRAEALRVDPCLAAAHQHLVKALQFGDQGMRLFLDRAADSTVNSTLDMGAARLEKLDEELDRVSACAPFCR